MTITPQLMQIYRALADKGFGNRSPKEQERIISQALRAADFVPPGEELSLHEMAEDAGIDLQASEQHSGFARAKATADRIGFGASEKFAATVDRGTWVKGTLPSSHRWQARVFQRATVYGIPEVPRIEDLLIADPRGIAIVEYSRGWDTKPKSGDIAVYNAATTAALGAVKSANAREKFASAGKIEADARNEYLALKGRTRESVRALYRQLCPRGTSLNHRDMAEEIVATGYGAVLAAKIARETAWWSRTGGKDSFAFSKDLGRQLRAVRSDIASQQANLRADDKEGHWSNCMGRCVALQNLYGNSGLAGIYREMMNTKATGREETNGGNYSRAGGKALMGFTPMTQEQLYQALSDPNVRSLPPWKRDGMLAQARRASNYCPPGKTVCLWDLADQVDGGDGGNLRPITRSRNARPESSAVARRLGAFARDRFAEAAKPSAKAIAEMKALIKKAKAEAEGASRPSDRTWWMEEAEQYEAILQAVLRNDPHEVSVIADGMSKNAADRIPMAIITWGDYAT